MKHWKIIKLSLHYYFNGFVLRKIKQSLPKKLPPSLISKYLIVSLLLNPHFLAITQKATMKHWHAKTSFVFLVSRVFNLTIFMLFSPTSLKIIAFFLVPLESINTIMNLKTQRRMKLYVGFFTRKNTEHNVWIPILSFAISWSTRKLWWKRAKENTSTRYLRLLYELLFFLFSFPYSYFSFP